MLNLCINVISNIKDDEDKNQEKDGNVNKENATENRSEMNVI